jgi:hypothetical protein
VITLAKTKFAGPFLAPLWSPALGAAQLSGVYAVMVPGWRVMTFRALHFGQAQELSMDEIRSHGRYAEWHSIAGTEWNLYIAVHEMSFSTAAQREAVARALARDYRPEFNPLAPDPQKPGPRLPVGTLLLAQAMRNHKDD